MNIRSGDAPAPAPAPRHERIADAALNLLAERGMRGLTHRAVDEAAGLPQGSTLESRPHPGGPAGGGGTAAGRAGGRGADPR